MLPPSGPVMLPAIPQHVVANAAGRCFTRGSLVFFQRAEQKLSKKPRRGEQRGKQSKSRKGTISKFAIHHNPLPTTRVEIGSSAAAADVHIDMRLAVIQQVQFLALPTSILKTSSFNSCDSSLVAYKEVPLHVPFLSTQNV